MSDAAPIPTVDRIFLHIGTEKTGTTTLQSFLSANRQTLRRQGVLYPAFTGQHGGSQWGFVASVTETPWRSDIGLRLGIRDALSAVRYREQLTAAIDAELREGPPCHALVISSEHFHSRCRRPDDLLRLQQLLTRWFGNITVILYLRRQDRVAVSLYSTRLKSGYSNDDVFRTQRRPRFPTYFDYERLYLHWASVFGEKALRVVVYDRVVGDPLGVLNSFCQLVGIDLSDTSLPINANQSLSRDGVRLLRALNRRWPVQAPGKLNPVRAYIVSQIAKSHAGRCDLVSRSQAQAFYAPFADGNARLAARLFPDVDQPLFDDDFDHYPRALPAPDDDGIPTADTLLGDVLRRAIDHCPPLMSARLHEWIGPRLSLVLLHWLMWMARVRAWCPWNGAKRRDWHARRHNRTDDGDEDG
jgi:hypothetical protein